MPNDTYECLKTDLKKASSIALNEMLLLLLDKKDIR